MTARPSLVASVLPFALALVSLVVGGRLFGWFVDKRIKAFVCERSASGDRSLALTALEPLAVWASDVFQFVPSVVTTAVGAFLISGRNRHLLELYRIAAIAFVVVSIFGTRALVRAGPVSYARVQRLGYATVTWVLIAMNVAFLLFAIQLR